MEPAAFHVPNMIYYTNCQHYRPPPGHLSLAFSTFSAANCDTKASLGRDFEYSVSLTSYGSAHHWHVEECCVCPFSSDI